MAEQSREHGERRLRSGQDPDGLAMFVKGNHAFKVWDGGSYGVDEGSEGFSSLIEIA